MQTKTEKTKDEQENRYKTNLESRVIPKEFYVRFKTNNQASEASLLSLNISDSANKVAI